MESRLLVTHPYNIYLLYSVAQVAGHFKFSLNINTVITIHLDFFILIYTASAATDTLAQLSFLTLRVSNIEF